MTRDEILFFKLNDSDHARAWRVPHSAFRDPAAKATSPGTASSSAPSPTSSSPARGRGAARRPALLGWRER